MTLSLPPHIQRAIEERIKSGKYATPEDVVAAAVTSLVQQEQSDSFGPGELDELLAEGERDIERGDVLDADEAFAELRRLSAERRSKAG